MGTGLLSSLAAARFANASLLAGILESQPRGVWTVMFREFAQILPVEPQPMPNDRIVSIGFLTQNDLDRLGKTFERHIPVPDDDIFADLLSQLDKIDAEPFGDGVMLVPHRQT